MIDKIKNKTGTYCGQILPVRQDTIINKINELVDAVNRYEDIIRQIGEWGSSKGECLWCENLTKVKLGSESHPVNMQDKFAEQRKWIGKLCRFWDDDDKYCVFGILDDIDDNSQISGSRAIYFDSESAGWWEHCEPVKPDDDIIYKGE